MTLSTLGHRIKHARLDAEITQVEAAKRAGVRQSEWSQWESDNVVPTVASLHKIAKALNVEITGLIVEEGDS